VSDAVDVVREILRLAGTMEVDGLAAHLADSVVMELPFAPEGYAREHVGKEAVVRFQRAAARSFRGFAMYIDRVMSTDDRHVVVAEHHSDGIAAPTGRPYRNRYVTVFELDDDHLVSRWTEYYDPAVVTAAFS
jgi:ketosteroid isomerase-like protein